MPTIGELKVMLGVDAAGMIKGIQFAKDELRAAGKVMESLVTPTDRLNQSQAVLFKLLAAEKITLEQYNKEFARLSSEMPEAIAAREKAAEATRKQEEAARRHRQALIDESAALNGLVNKWREFGRSDVDRWKSSARELLSVRQNMSRDEFRAAWQKMRDKDPRIIEAELVNDIGKKTKAALLPAVATEATDLDRALATVAPRLSSITQSAGPLTAALGVGAVALGTFSAGWSTLNKALDISVRNLTDAYHELDRIGDTAEMLGMTASALGQIESVARSADVSTQSLSAALERMAAGVGDALGADGETAFSKLNLDVMELASLAPERQFARIAQQIDLLPTMAEKLAAITDVFGKANNELIKMIEGFDAVNAAAGMRADFATSLDVAIIDEMDQSVRDMDSSWKRMWQETLVQIAPAIRDITEALAEFLREGSTVQSMVGAFEALRQEITTLANITKSVGVTSERAGMATTGTMGVSAGLFALPGGPLAAMFGRNMWRNASEQSRRDMSERASLSALRDALDADAASGGKSHAPITRMLDKMAADDLKKFQSWIKGGDEPGMLGKADLDRETRALEGAAKAREDYIARIEKEAQTAGMNDREKFAFDIAQMGFGAEKQNYLLKLFDRTKAANMEPRQLGTPAALKGSQEAAQAVARWMSGQNEQVDALDKIEENTRRMAEAGQFVIVEVQGAL